MSLLKEGMSSAPCRVSDPVVAEVEGCLSSVRYQPPSREETLVERSSSYAVTLHLEKASAEAGQFRAAG